MDVQIAERLQRLRKTHGYSQEQLADELGVSRQAVSKWERAEASPDTDNLIALARLYGMSLDDMINESEGSTVPDEAVKKSEEVKLFTRGKEDGDDDADEKNPQAARAEGLAGGLTVFGVIIAYLLMGFLGGLWHPSWIIFFAIPGVPSIVGAIMRKNARIFAYPVFVTAVFLLMGFLLGWWAFCWIVFLTIPVYYLLLDFFVKK